MVEIFEDKHGQLQGRSPQLTRNFMEIRGLRIINIKEIFGPCGPCRKKRRSNLVIRLKKWSKKNEVDRLGLKFRKITCWPGEGFTATYSGGSRSQYCHFD